MARAPFFQLGGIGGSIREISRGGVHSVHHIPIGAHQAGLGVYAAVNLPDNMLEELGPIGLLRQISSPIKQMCAGIELFPFRICEQVADGVSEIFAVVEYRGL